MPFANRIRLPFYLHQPQFPTEAVRFRRADGTTKTLSSVIRKTYKLTTDWLTENAHQKLVIALNHKFVTMEGTRLISNVVLDSEYDITWQDFLDYPLGQATSSVQVSPFDISNDNCVTCAQASQLEAHDDNIGTINEGGEDEYTVINNDHICCSPVTFEIVWWELKYIDLVTINEQTGKIFITMKTQTPSSVVDVKLLTYRVTCPDGSYDDADVYGTVTGSLPDCVPPVFQAPVFDDTYMTASWLPAYAKYYATLAYCSDPNNPPFTWTIEDTEAPQIIMPMSIIGAGVCWILCVQKDCGVDGLSEWNCLQFISPGGGETCREFQVTANDGTTGNDLYQFSYRDCAGFILNGFVHNLQTTTVCMLAHSITHEPIYFAAGPYVDYADQGVCTL